MKAQTTLLTAALALCLTLLSLTPGLKTPSVAAQGGAPNYPPPQTKVCGTVTEFQAATAVSTGVLTIGGVRFIIATGASLSGLAVGANVCATFCFNTAGQIASADGITANAGATQICGIVNAFDPYMSIAIGGAKLRMVVGTFIQGQAIIAPGVNVCLTPVYEGSGLLTFGSSVVEAPSTLPIRVPALVHGFSGPNEAADIFQLPEPFVLNVQTPIPATATVTPVGGYFYTPYLGFKQKGIHEFSYSTPNSAVRATTCADSLWDLFFQIRSRNDVVDDMVTLSLQKPDGSGSFVVAMFIVAAEARGVILTQVAPDVQLFAFGHQGALKVGDLILFSGDGVTGRTTPTITAIFSMNSSRLKECLQYVVELKRSAWPGTISIVHIAAVVKRLEQFADRGGLGEGLTSGDFGWYPTGRMCALACEACLPPPPQQPLPGSLSGFVYCDLNNNGIKEAGEPALSSVLVSLTGTDINGAVNKTTTTDANGFYIFANLMPGVYKITESQPASATDGIDTVGSLGGDTTNDMFANIPLASLGQGINYNFGEQCTTATPTPTPTPTPNNAKCDTVCWRSTQWLLNNPRNWPGGTVLAAGYNANNPMGIQSNLSTLRGVLQGGPSAQQRLNREFVTAQLSLSLAGGPSSPVVFNVFWSPLRCSQVSFSSVTLSNSIVFTPETLLDTLMNQTVLAIRDNRQQDYDELANMWALLNGRCGY